MGVFVRHDVEEVETTATTEVPVLVIGGMSPATARAVEALALADETVTANAQAGKRQNVVVRVSAHGSYAKVQRIDAPVSKYN